MKKKEAFQLTSEVWHDSIVKQLSEGGIDNPDEKIIKKLWKMEDFSTYDGWRDYESEDRDWKNTDYYKYRDEISLRADCWSGPGSVEKLVELYNELKK